LFEKNKRDPYNKLNEMRLCVDVGRTTFGWKKKGKGFVLFFGYQGVDPVITGNDGHRRAEKNDNEEKTQGFLGFMFVYDIKRKRMAICSGTCLSNTPGWMDGWPSIWSVPFFLPSFCYIATERRAKQKEETGDHTPKGWIHSVGLKGRKEGRKEGLCDGCIRVR
jgi:hypothetical protein